MHSSTQIDLTGTAPHMRARLLSLLSLGVALPLLASCAGDMQSGGSTTMAAAPSHDMNISNDMSHRYGEVQIAVNPKNPMNLVYADVEGGVTVACIKEKRPECVDTPSKSKAVGIPMAQPKGFFTNVKDFSTIGVFASFDGGKTWQRSVIPIPSKDHPNLTGNGDPSVAVQPDGTFYISYDNMDWGTPDDALRAGGIGVSKSTDGGKTWTTPYLTGTPMDGPKIVADPNTGTLYANSSTVLGPLSTGNPDAPRGKISTRWIASSKDGVHWTTPQSAGGTAFVAAANGLVVAAFKTASQANLFGDANDELCGNAPKPCVIFQTSKDSGATWDRHLLPPEAANSSGGPGGGAMVAADPSKPGHFAVAVQTNGGKQFEVYETKDSGKTWNKTATVTDSATNRKDHPWMNYSSTGVLGIVWRSLQTASAPPPPPTAPVAPAPAAQGRAAPTPPMTFGGTPVPFSMWAVISRDGGTTFSAPLKISSADSPVPTDAGSAAGDDYSSIVLDKDTAFIGWADWRPGDRQAYFRAVKFSEFK